MRLSAHLPDDRRQNKNVFLPAFIRSRNGRGSIRIRRHTQVQKADYFFFFALVLEGESFAGFSMAPERMRRLLTVSVG